jgi:threonine/homoserine/homoserine lactone efflux protein
VGLLLEYKWSKVMSLETWLLFSGAALVVILIPGPLSLLMISNSLNYGLRRSYPAFLGGVIASICLLSASALGLGALLLASEQLFSALKIVGALYLFYLAWQSWQQSRQPAVGAEVPQAAPVPRFAPCSAAPSCWARAIRRTFCFSPRFCRSSSARNNRSCRSY